MIPITGAFGTLDVWTDPVYYTGDPIRVSFETFAGLDASITIDIIGPISASWGPKMIIGTGAPYTATISGATVLPGYYTVKVTMGLTYDVYEGSASFQVIQRTPFDFTISLSPSSATVKKGETTQFNWAVTYSDPSYRGTKFTWDISGLDSSMKATVKQGILTIKTSDITPPGTYTFMFTLSAKGTTRSATGTVIVEALFDYSLTISPSTQTVTIGEKTSYSVTISLVSGSAQPSSLSLSGLPSEISYVFSPPSGTPPFTSTLTIDTAASSSPETYTLTATATGGGVTRTTTIELIINEKDFQIITTPDTTSVKQSETTRIQVEIKPLGNFNEPVTLTLTGAPSGVTPQFNPPSGTPLFISTLTIDTSLSTPEGSYTLTIDAVGGGKTHSTQATLNVEKTPFTLTISTSIDGTKIKVSGTVTPPQPGTKITLIYTSPEHHEEEDGGKFTQEATVNPDGSFTDELTVKLFGEWEVRAILEESGETIAISNIDYFTIEPPWYYKYIQWLPEWFRNLFG